MTRARGFSDNDCKPSTARERFGEQRGDRAKGGSGGRFYRRDLPLQYQGQLRSLSRVLECLF